MDTLLDLDGSILDQGGGYWVKFEARLTDSTPEVPHGVRHSLTLHGPNGDRILGYDNAHGVKPRGRARYAGRIVAYDHKHRYKSEKVIPYKFRSAQQLIDDFFTDVDRVLQEIGCV